MSFSSAFKSFWHTLTSNDRHSSFDSPYRTGQHVPLNSGGSRMSALASVATASESRPDVSSPYHDETAGFSRVMSPTVGGRPPLSRTGSNQPYSPGSRSASARRQAQTTDGFEMQSPTGEIPMQSFQDGLPPPPPVSNSWHRIDAWAEENYPELYDQLGDGCTTNDLNELEHMLDCSLPMDVRESLQIHDGQERWGTPTGIIFGSMLLDCEEIVQEWETWRKVNFDFLQENAASSAPTAPAKTLSSQPNGSDEASSSTAPPPQPTRIANPMWRQELQAKQSSVPHNAVQRVYSHPAWIPLVRDWGGNNLAIDLAPGPAGQWGQVILFGRDYDTKYVVARSWSALMATVADDLNSGKWFIDEETNELKLREFKSNRVEPAYFDILRWRADQKYGRPGMKRRSPAASVGTPTPTGSPYSGPVDATAEARGRPLQRLGANSPLGSPNRPGFGKMSPLSRVTEETALPPLNIAAVNAKAGQKLVEVETPRTSGDENAPTTTKTAMPTVSTPVTNGTKMATGKSAASATAVADDGMKTIEI